MFYAQPAIKEKMRFRFILFVPVCMLVRITVYYTRKHKMNFVTINNNVEKI